MDTYLKQKKWLDAQACKKHEQNKSTYSITSNAKKYLIEIDLSTDNIS